VSGQKEEEDTSRIFEQPWRILPHLFAKYASGGKWIPYRHLRYISIELARVLTTGGGRFIITCPPRHGKSELISNWLPTWYLYNNPEKKIILASYAAEFASKWGAKVRENLTENPLIQIPLSKSTKGKKHFMTLEGGQMMTAGMGGPITGSGADVFIVDDPIKNWQDAQSDLIRERHKDWFRSVALTRLEPGASIVILQTRWHEDDLSGWLLSGKDTDDVQSLNKPWRLINFPALCEDANDVLGRRLGAALCPERYSAESLKEIQSELGELIWSALFQQRPSSLQGNIILKEWIRYYDTRPDKFDEQAIFADLTFKEGTTTDFTVVECWGRVGSNIYLLDQMRARMGFPDQIAAIREMAKRFPNAYFKQIEEAANGAAVIEMLKNEIIGLVGWKPQTSKEARLAAVSPLYQAGNVHYPSPRLNSWVEINISEVLSFPNAKHDDTVDVASMAVNYFGKASSSVARLEALGRW
jgi:predicted phage terminase large subunit-like protein